MPASQAVPAFDRALLAHSLVVGVTGHRKLRADVVAMLEAQVSAFLTELRTRHPSLPLVLLSPLAEGSDQLVTRVALDMGLRVIAPLPMPLDLYRADFTDPRERAAFEDQLSQVEVVELPLVGDATRTAVATPGPLRDRQYAHAGCFVSGHCHVLLALWDGEASVHVGGTANVVRFHLQGAVDAPGERTHAAATLLGPDRENLVYCIPAARQGHADPAATTPRWLIDDEGMRESDVMPAEFAQMFERQQQFTDDAHRHASQIADESAPTHAAAECPVWQAFRAADWLARTYQRRVARVLLATYVLVALMGFTYFSYTHIAGQNLLIYGFVLLFAVGMGVTTLASRGQWQRKYLDYRTLAEGLRVQSYWRRAGIVVPGTTVVAHDNFLQSQDVELGWIRNVMRGASLDGMLVPAGEGGATDAQAVDAVIREWIGTPDSGGQLAYYAASSRRRARHHHRSEQLGKICIGLGVALSVLLALSATQLDAHAKHIVVSVMGILSVAAAVHEAYVYKKADKELIRQYRFMQRIFGSAQRLLDESAAPEDKRRILIALGEAALTEHAEWTLMHRERPLPQSRI